MLRCLVRSCNTPENGRSLFKAYWQIIPKITVKESPSTKKLSSEAYRIKVTGSELEISAVTAPGVMNAMKTLRQLAEVDRGTEKLTGYFLVQCEISDEPAMEFRGIHLCVFPETPLWDIEKHIRPSIRYARVSGSCKRRHILRFYSGGRRALEELLGIAAGSVVLPCRSGIQGHEASEMAESDFPECRSPLGEHDAEYL